MLKIFVIILMASILVPLVLSNLSPHSSLPAEKAPEKAIIAPEPLNSPTLDEDTIQATAERIEQSCGNNKFELTQDECLDALKARKDVCTRLTLQRYPEIVNPDDRLRWLTAHFENCIFQQ